MMRGKVKLAPMRCVCGWAGSIGVTAPCPSCGSRDRITPARERILVAIDRGEQPTIPGVTRQWFARLHLLELAAPRAAAVGDKREPRIFQLTAAGARAIGLPAATVEVPTATMEGAAAP